MACVTPGATKRNWVGWEIELREELCDLVERVVRRPWRAEEKRQDVVVGNVLRAALVDLRDALSEDHGAVWDRRHPHDRGRPRRIGRLRHRRPDPRLDVQAGAGTGLADLLHVGQPEHVDVVHP
jgi:hypothetical protein